MLQLVALPTVARCWHQGITFSGQGTTKNFVQCPMDQQLQRVLGNVCCMSADSCTVPGRQMGAHIIVKEMALLPQVWHPSCPISSVDPLYSVTVLNMSLRPGFPSGFCFFLDCADVSFFLNVFPLFCPHKSCSHVPLTLSSSNPPPPSGSCLSLVIESSCWNQNMCLKITGIITKYIMPWIYYLDIILCIYLLIF